MTTPEPLPTHLVRGRHVFHIGDGHQTAVALELPNNVVILGLYFDGVLIRMLDEPGDA